MTSTTVQVDRVRRFRFNKPIAATFRGAPITLVDLSESGARGTHSEPLVAGLSGTLGIPVPSSGEPLKLKAAVVWSRVLADGRMETGLKIVDERSDRAADILDHLVRLGWTGQGRCRAAGNKLRGTDGDLRAARQALEFLSKNRSAAARWKHLVQREMAPSANFHLDTLAAWELLGRTIDLELVARAKRELEPFVLDGESLLIEDEMDFELVPN